MCASHVTGSPAADVRFGTDAQPNVDFNFVGGNTSYALRANPLYT